MGTGRTGGKKTNSVHGTEESSTRPTQDVKTQKKKKKSSGQMEVGKKVAVKRRGWGWRYWASARKRRVGRGQKAMTGAN